MLETRLLHLERHRHMEDLPTVLNGDDPARAEALAVAASVDLVQNGNLGVARHEKVRMKRMTETVFHRPGRGHQRLTQHLPAKNPLRTVFGTHPAEDVDFDSIEVEQRDQLLDG